MNEQIDEAEGQYLSRYSIIFVDDEPNILQSLRRVFHYEPYRFLASSSGDEALGLIAQTPSVAVIVSDQRMPGMNGSEFLTRCRDIAPDAVKMLLTGYSDMESTIAAINSGGATHFIVKPWDDSQLLQTVREAVMRFHLILENRRQQETINAQNLKLTELLGQLTDQNEELKRLASTDGLTELTNRRTLFEFLGTEVSRVRRYGGTLSLLMIDIDHFKRVNDTWGHAAGDTVLRNIAQLIRLALRDVDIAGRYGGEEFVVLLPETEIDGALQIAERLRLSVAGTPVPQESGPLIPVTISVGVGQLAAEESGESLLSRADQAMYRAKNNGRDRVETASLDIADDTDKDARPL